MPTTPRLDADTIPARPIGYPAIKRAEIRASMGPHEQEELEQLEARARLSPASHARVDALWAQAFALHVPPQVDPLVAYAPEVGEGIRSRRPQRWRTT
jgi:hypothetical protein